MSSAANQHGAPEPATSVGVLALDQDKVRDLKAKLRGESLQPGEAGYDAARVVWNAMIDRRPALIARCRGVADVVAVVVVDLEAGVGQRLLGGGHTQDDVAVGAADGLEVHPLRAVEVVDLARDLRLLGRADVPEPEAVPAS